MNRGFTVYYCRKTSALARLGTPGMIIVVILDVEEKHVVEAFRPGLVSLFKLQSLIKVQFGLTRLSRYFGCICTEVK